MKKIKVQAGEEHRGLQDRARATVRGLGLRRINHVVELVDTPAVRGMINRVTYLVRLDELA